MYGWQALTGGPLCGGGAQISSCAVHMSGALLLEPRDGDCLDQNLRPVARDAPAGPSSAAAGGAIEAAPGAEPAGAWEEGDDWGNDGGGADDGGMDFHDGGGGDEYGDDHGTVADDGSTALVPPGARIAGAAAASRRSDRSAVRCPRRCSLPLPTAVGD